MRAMLHVRAIACAGVALVLGSLPVFAQDVYVYWVSIRSYSNSTAPSYVVATTSPSGAQTMAYQGCDGNTYYLSQADLTAVQSAMTANDTVQLNTGPSGSSPDDSAIVCMVQAGS